MQLFFDKARCDSCHEGMNFTTNAYHNLGVGTRQARAGCRAVRRNQGSGRLGRVQDADAA